MTLLDKGLKYLNILADKKVIKTDNAFVTKESVTSERYFLASIGVAERGFKYLGGGLTHG